MKTNDLKKGMRVKLANGWYATIADNMKGNTRMATVEGTFTETGSVYSHDIMWYLPPTGAPVMIQYTLAQDKMRELVNAA